MTKKWMVGVMVTCLAAGTAAAQGVTSTMSDPPLPGRSTVVDASQQGGADFCAKVKAAIAALPAPGGTVDARGLADTQSCSGDPFGGVTTQLTLLLGASTISVRANMTVPSNVTVVFAQGAVLSISNGATVTWKGAIEAPVSQIFSLTGNGAVNFASPFRRSAVYPEWWGATGDGTTDDSAAINAAIAAVKRTGGTVLLSPATYAVASSVNLTRGHVNLIGSGEFTTVLQWRGVANGTVLDASSLNHSEVKAFQVNCNSTAGIGIDATAMNSTGVSIQNVFEHLYVANCLGSPGYDIHVGSSTDQQISETLFHGILLGRAATNGIYQEGTQTANIAYDGVAGGPGPGANGFNIRTGSAFIVRYSAGNSSVAIRLSNTILLANVQYAEWEGGGNPEAAFLVMEDGTGNGNAGPLVTIEDSRMAWLNSGSTKVISWGVSTGAAGHLKLARCKFDRFAGTPQIFVMSPSGIPAYFTEFDNTYLLTPVVTKGLVRRLFLSSSPSSDGDTSFIKFWTGGVIDGITVGATTVSSLPSAPLSKGRLFVVTDSAVISAEGQACRGGSNNVALAFSNGSVWKCF